MSFIGVSNDFILTFGTLDTILVITYGSSIQQINKEILKKKDIKKHLEK